jgi:hypothetical protein
VGRFPGLVCGAGVAAASGCRFSFGVTPWSGVATARGVFWPEGGLSGGLGVGPPASGWLGDSERAGVVEGLGAIRFGGFRLGPAGPGPFPPVDCLSTGGLAVVGFSPGFGGAPEVTEGTIFGGAPAEAFGPSRFGGSGFFPEVAAFGGALGTILAVGEGSPGLTKPGGVFGPATADGVPGVAPAGPVVGPRLPICGFTKGVGFGWSLGGGFCSAIVLLSFAAS